MFTTPCFIRKNTPELRKKLEEFGYVDNSLYRENEANLYVGGYIYTSADFIDPYYYDCGTNEELFLALAALRDDSDINQWFIYNSMDCIIEKLRTIDWFICNENSIEDFACYDSSYLNCHKATVEEIIEHFKKE